MADNFCIEKNKITFVSSKDGYFGTEITFCHNTIQICDICFSEKKSDFYKIKFGNKISKKDLIPLHSVCINCFTHVFENMLFHSHYKLDACYEKEIIKKEIIKSEKCCNGKLVSFSICRSTDTCHVCANQQAPYTCFFKWTYYNTYHNTTRNTIKYCTDCLLKIAEKKILKTVVKFAGSDNALSTAIKITLIPSAWSPAGHHCYPLETRQIVTNIITFVKQLKKRHNVMIDKHIIFHIFRMVF